MEPDPCFQLPAKLGKTNDGGLRTRGFYKAEGSEPIVTVITIAYNCASSIEETMLSVLNQTYSNIEYIVIDGGSVDGTVDVIKKYDHAIDYWVSEPDRGIYDAMNIGVRASTGKWLNFMNVKDVFFREDTIQVLADKYLKGQARFIYSDVLLRHGPFGKDKVARHVCNHEKLIIHHQGSIYQKSLHLEYGPYIVAKGMTISDYLFFSLIDQKNYLKSEDPIAIFDMTGISSAKGSARQKLIVDYLINRMPMYECLMRFQLLYCPEKIEKILVWAVRLSRKARGRT